MLIIKACINHIRIDEIHIVNTGHIKDGKHLYRIRKPEGLNHHEIYHDRKLKWFYLVAQVLEILQDNDIDPESWEDGKHGI